MTPMNRGVELDHLAFGCADVGATREDLERLGFSPTPLSSCSWLQDGAETSARSVSVVFAEQYLDFIEILDPRWRDHLTTSEVYGRGVAPSGIVVRGPAPAEALSTWRARGAEVDEPYEIVRDFEDGGVTQIHYEFLALRGSGLPLGLIRDTAPSAMRTQAWTSHPNGATGIRRLHLRVPSVAQSRRSLQPFSGIDLEGARVSLHEEPKDPYLAEVALCLGGSNERPALLAAEIEVSDLEDARQFLSRNEVAWLEEPGSLSVLPSEGHGTGFRFVA